MIIKRIIDGNEVSVELTRDELVTAHEEYQHIMDVTYCKGKIEFGSEDAFKEEYGVSKEDAMKQIDAIAYEMRRQADKYDLDDDYARECAFSEILLKTEYV